ncbi:MAG: glycosyltransferase family 2 protein [Candidatus Omnitrophica bacterium]|nr:glycosyltransferase family 2 protein [Candidatus Omnitrophota bacterium]
MIETSVVIPIYNAAGMIEDAIARIVDVMDPLRMNYEILLCDDGSTDGSGEVLKRIASRYPEARCFYNLSNRGLGATLKRLLNDAQGEKIVYCDCDLPFGADAIPVLLKGLEVSDITVASRYRGAVNRTPFTRKVCSRLYYFLCRLLFNIPVMDIGSGSVAMCRRVAQEISLKARGFDVHAEFYLKALKMGFAIDEISVESMITGQGSFCIWVHGPDALVKTFKLYLESLKGALTES